jgi:hypothetical protein
MTRLTRFREGETMRGTLIALAVAAGVGLFGISSGLAAPIDGSAILPTDL